MRFAFYLFIFSITTRKSVLFTYLRAYCRVVNKYDPVHFHNIKTKRM